MSAATQNILYRLDNVATTNDGWSARCPCHDDKKNSLCVDVGDDGRVLIFCQAGCSTPDILSAVGLQMKNLFDEQRCEKSRIVECYDYRGEVGSLLFQVVRFQPKDFRQRKPDGNGWSWKLGSIRRVLYKLPEMIASNPLQSVFVVEGEKDCDRLRSMELVATTCAGGAKKWRDEYNESLKNRKVVVLPDNDSPGREHAEQVAASLQGIALSVKVIELPNLPLKGDVSDWLDAGGTKEQLRKLVESATVWEPGKAVPQESGERESTDKLNFERPLPTLKTLEQSATEYIERVESGKQLLVSLGIPDLDYAIGGGVEFSEMIVIGARPGHGKSVIGLQSTDSATTEGLPSLIVSEEMSSLAIGKRAIQFASNVAEEHWRHQAGQVKMQLASHFSSKVPCFISESVGSAGRAATVIRRAVEEHGVRFVVVDYAQLLTSSGRSRYEQVSNTSITLRQLANELRIIIVVLVQLNRQVESRDRFIPRLGDIKDSGQLEQDADCVLFLVWPHRIDRKEDPHKYQIFVAKNRNRAINQSVVECKFFPSRQMIEDEKASFADKINVDELFAQDSY